MLGKSSDANQSMHTYARTERSEEACSTALGKVVAAAVVLAFVLAGITYLEMKRRSSEWENSGWGHVSESLP